MFKIAEKLGAERLAELGTEMEAAYERDAVGLSEGEAMRTICAVGLTLALGVWSATPHVGRRPGDQGRSSRPCTGQHRAQRPRPGRHA